MCVKWGTLYGPEFVNNLYAMVKRNLTIPFRFICLTDDETGIHKDIDIIPTPSHLQGWWQKIAYFQTPLADITGPILALDLDVIVVDNIDCFFSYQPDDFVMKIDKPTHGFSSCVMRFNANQYSHIYNNLNLKKIDHAIDNSDRNNFKKKKYWGDQIWITEQMEQDPQGRQVKTWPKPWIPLFGVATHTPPGTKKRFIIPESAKIIAWAAYKNDQRRHYEEIKHIWHSDNITKNYR